MSSEAVTRHGMVTALYRCPLTHEQLMDAEISDLARFIGQLHLRVPGATLERLEQGMAELTERGGPAFDRPRYTLAEARAEAISVLMQHPPTGTRAHPIEVEPDVLWPN
ncbi:hypothetical protein F1721_06610 [Saccharopolyspora hirsuta]|uniref:Uncharacterized protein n=1 Tax=Saccharopolyspora hirsuta TaxID=1837 RepID=A0A5M7C8N4_SACHI|nr:hypothetical protein [Saccharopolyspora hirsuta]KAA5836014.1 hypothetical protein F1721_06610 [Saccharopolyspora hirsuta]